ncbi:ATP-binding cassette domain-containing protein [Peptoniphilus lacrimalis]|uniref:ATP-binding cassette domain-containing protein n=1 Tax=Peptoniphilus lacrimalis TaxID=33031 RepID=UPI003C6DF15C
MSVRNVSYRYPTSDVYALKNINLEIKQGDFIAIIGRNGSGKSTLMKILLGYYDDYEGEIFVNGINLRNINHRSYLNCIGALFQDFTKYEATIRENVCYSNLDKIDDDEMIKNVCKQFGLEELIKREPKDIDTQLGFWFEDGKQISIGQWQKVALSRAFVRDADLYFLDEPNAALDPVSEYQMAQMYKEIFKNKIGIVIVHKFNHYVDKADKIVILKDGVISVVGTHNELIKNSEEYSELYKMSVE